MKPNFQMMNIIITMVLRSITLHPLLTDVRIIETSQFKQINQLVYIEVSVLMTLITFDNQPVLS